MFPAAAKHQQNTQPHKHNTMKTHLKSETKLS